VAWFDPFLGGPRGMGDFVRFHALAARRHLHFLRADSADHGGFRLDSLPATSANDPYTNDRALHQILEVQVGDTAVFMDPSVQGRGEMLPPRRRVRWHLGYVGWFDGSEWPPPGVQPLQLYFSPATIGDRAGMGLLLERPESRKKV